jgi:predicted DNA-binding protein with PD1-like motif
MFVNSNSMLRIVIVCWVVIFLPACQSKNMKQETTRTYAFRLKPGDDLQENIFKLVKEKKIEAGWIATCAGSLTDYAIRFANQPEASKGNGHFEIVSLTGTVSINGSHLHISISDSTGKTTGDT